MTDKAASIVDVQKPMPSRIDDFLQALLSRSVLTSPEQKAILSLVGQPERLKTGQGLVGLGDDTVSSCLVLDGFCARVNLPTEEGRVITAIYVRGNMPDLYSVFEPQAAATLEAVTPATILRIPHGQVHELMRAHPAVTEAFTRYLAADTAISMQWLANIAGHRAILTVAHLLCEMAVRLDSVADNTFSFWFPLSQELLSQACGMSPVHMNRSLTQLRDAGLVTHNKGIVCVLDWEKLKALAHFDDRYLVAHGQRCLFN